MALNIQYSNEQIEKIRQEGFIYTCACPSQVAQQIASLRKLYDYQTRCVNGHETPLSIKTHDMIVAATVKAHDMMQQCLHEVLVHEEWDLETLCMPENLRQQLEDLMNT